MDRDHRVFIVERNSMVTSDPSDKVRVQCIKWSSFWRSENQRPRKGKGGGLVFEGCEVGKIRLGDKKGGSTSHDPWCNRRRKHTAPHWHLDHQAPAECPTKTPSTSSLCKISRYLEPVSRESEFPSCLPGLSLHLQPQRRPSQDFRIGISP